jgi:hypothetical protein
MDVAPPGISILSEPWGMGKSFWSKARRLPAGTGGDPRVEGGTPRPPRVGGVTPAPPRGRPVAGDRE